MNNAKSSAFLRMLLLISLFTLVIVLSVHYMPRFMALLKDPESFRQQLLTHGIWSRLIFIGLQVLQVVVAFLPGEIVQIAGGYVFGVFMGTIYSLSGILLGSVIAFFLSRWLGYPFLRIFVSKQYLDRFDFLLNTKKAEVITFMLFLLPGLPKDVLTYIAGLTPIRSGSFFLVAILGRFPGILVSSLIGVQLGSRQYLRSGILAGLAALLLLLSVMYRDRFIFFLSRKDSRGDSLSPKARRNSQP